MPDALNPMDDWDADIPEQEPTHSTPDPEPVEGIVPLGYDRGVFFYLSRAARQVHAIPAAQHSRNTLMAMASVAHYWQRTTFCNDKGQVAWDAAIDDLMNKCRQVGIFDPDRIRGRGAWLDDGRAVLHLGDKLIVDGEPGALTLPGSTHVYEAGKRLLSGASEPLSTQDAHALVEICRSLRWERPIDGVLLAGWLAVAPVCGGLYWRPSIWLTGGAGSGKSYVQDNIMGPAIGGVALRVQSKTSEAGIRQMLGGDARPVIFDEAEREDGAAAARMQGVLDLVRQSSSEGAAEIVKGSQNQTGAKRYRVRSCFAFSSINVGIEHHADETRITVLTLRPARASITETDTFAKLHARVTATFTPGFAAGLLARSVRLLPIIRANAETFAQAVALHLGSRRAGDQLGALLAGAYSLYSERAITPGEATDYIRKQDWSQATEQDADKDERRLLGHLTQHRARVSLGNRAPIECTIGRMISAALGRDEMIPADDAERELRQIGFRSDPGGVFVSTSHPAIRASLHGTPWAAGWSRALLRLPGAETAQKNLRFGFGFVGKATFLPLAVLENEDHNEGAQDG